MKAIIGICLALLAAVPARAQGFHESFSDVPFPQERTWIGPDFWANRLQDWSVDSGSNGALKCVATAPRLRTRTLHLLTYRVGDHPGGFGMSVHTGLTREQGPVVADSATGFLIGVGGDEMDYRAAAIVHQWPGNGGGLIALAQADGRLVLRDNSRPSEIEEVAASANSFAQLFDPVELRLECTAPEEGRVTLTFSSHRPTTGEALATVTTTVPAARVVGGVALVSDPGPKVEGRLNGSYWFRDWRLSGPRVDHHPERGFGPFATTQYTLSRRVLQLTAQLLPVPEETGPVRLEVRTRDKWVTLASADIIRPGFTAPFIAIVDSNRDTRYRVAVDLNLEGDVIETHTFEGTIRYDPIDKETIVVAGFTGNHNNSHGIGGGGTDWANGMWFPHADLTARVAQHDPDVLFFSGDQIYEGKSPTFADRQNIQLDYLYKWYLWCWAYRDLTRNRPTITIPDDHDVFQGNVWGEGGRKTKRDHFGGYVHPAEFVKMVERTQTSHLRNRTTPPGRAGDRCVLHLDDVRPNRLRGDRGTGSSSRAPPEGGCRRRGRSAPITSTILSSTYRRPTCRA